MLMNIAKASLWISFKALEIEVEKLKWILREKSVIDMLMEKEKVDILRIEPLVLLVLLKTDLNLLDQKIDGVQIKICVLPQSLYTFSILFIYRMYLISMY